MKWSALTGRKWNELFIINYDIKYRMGLNGEEADADE
jgi:hypothetical protein